MLDKILFVDDEANVLSALKRQFRKQYAVSTAEGGADALKKIAKEGPFSVIVSDMQMPEMNGIQFLQVAQQMAPESVRLMLTGNADQQTAVDAVNKGCVFSFYTKPCAPEVMSQAIEIAVEQYHLITAERELLEGTLNGSVKLLLDMLSMVAPDAFGKTVAIQDMVGKLIDSFKLEDTWNLELAAMLSNIACVTLPPETLAKTWSDKTLSPQEKLMIIRLPEVGRNLISNIPRLERVAEIIFYQHKFFNGSGFPADDCSGENIPQESRILKVLHDLEDYKSQGLEALQALKRMAADTGSYDPVILNEVNRVFSSNDDSVTANTIINTTLNGLKPGQVLASNIETVEGKFLFSAGHKITSTIIERLLNYNQITKLKEPIQVSVNEHDDASPDDMDVAI
ncbi:MAG: response regulator [Gammaproteobacteria bacterium]|nr:response regulator [Gammaproteobacteria bacterium]